MKKTMRQLLALVLVLVLAASALSVTVFAAGGPDANGDYVITVNPSEYTDTSDPNRLHAYSIFLGTLADDYVESTTGAPVGNQLADIKWGTGIKIAEFVEGLKNADKFGTAFQTIVAQYGDAPKPPVTSDALATAVADVLAKKINDATFVDNFAALAVACRKDYDPSNNEVAVSTWNEEDEVWEIRVKNPGYYLILDTTTAAYKGEETEGEGGNEGGADKTLPKDGASGYILGVFGTQTVNMKDAAPTVDKDILDGSAKEKGEDFEIGELIPFEIVGTIAENYPSFDTYYYAFHDTMSKGLDLVTDSIEVYVLNGTTETRIYAGFSSPYDDSKDTRTLDIVFTDLKKVADLEQNVGVTINADSKIIVRYSAKLNKNAEIGTSFNKNEVKLEFSRDPHDATDHGETTIDINYVYSFGIDIFKVGDDKPDEGLEGAGFVLYKQNGTDEETGKPIYLYAVLEEIVEGEGDEAKVVGYVLKENSWVSSKDAATTALTDADGHLTIDGLEDGEYWLTETKTPSGYNTMKDVKIAISAEYDEDGKLIEDTLEIVVTGGTEGTAETGMTEEGRFGMTFVNDRAPVLPGTGGIGTVIFYVLGGLLLVGAAAYIVVSGRKKSKDVQ